MSTSRRARVQPLVSLWLAVALWLPAVASAEGEPTAPVEHFQRTLIEVMKEGPGIGFEGRRERLSRMVGAAFDMDAVTRAVIGRHYEPLMPEQRETLDELIERFAVVILASRFTSYDGERFEALTVRAEDASTAFVSGGFISSSGSRTGLDYALRNGGLGWRVVNVWFDGVSGTDIQRAEFEVFLREGGADRLARQLDELIDRITRGSS